MTWLVVHPWAQLLIGLLFGCWFGAAIATGGILLLVDRKIRKLESVNDLLRVRLRAFVRSPRRGAGGGGSMVVMPLRDSGSSTARVARVN